MCKQSCFNGPPVQKLESWNRLHALLEFLRWDLQNRFRTSETELGNSLLASDKDIVGPIIMLQLITSFEWQREIRGRRIYQLVCSSDVDIETRKRSNFSEERLWPVNICIDGLLRVLRIVSSNFWFTLGSHHYVASPKGVKSRTVKDSLRARRGVLDGFGARDKLRKDGLTYVIEIFYTSFKTTKDQYPTKVGI